MTKVNNNIKRSPIASLSRKRSLTKNDDLSDSERQQKVDDFVRQAPNGLKNSIAGPKHGTVTESFRLHSGKRTYFRETAKQNYAVPAALYNYWIDQYLADPKGSFAMPEN